MENSLHTFLIYCCILLLLPPSLRSQEVGDESEFSYGENSETGPSKWGEIKPEWRKCSAGKQQSPINVVKKSIETHPEKLNIDYRSSNATLINRGHDMMLQWTNGGGYIHVNGTHYQLKQLHWHVPSEHTVNGQRFDMEMHLVHETLDEKIAVIALLFKIGCPDSFLSTLENYLEVVGNNKTMEKDIGIIDPKETKVGKIMDYYKYFGSLTVPPCTQNVVWRIVEKKLKEFNGEDFRRWQKKMHFWLTALKVVYVLITPCLEINEKALWRRFVQNQNGRMMTTFARDTF